MLDFLKEKNFSLYKSTVKLLILTIVIIGFVGIRVFVRGSMGYVFLIWNIFLAWIPFYLSILFTQWEFKSKALRVITAFFWLMFYPNGPYILTDFIHLSVYNFYGSGTMAFSNKMSIWYNFFLISIFVVVGLVLSYMSLKLVHNYLNTRLGRVKAWIMVGVVSLLSGYAVYIGRFIRVNSWEVVTNPIGLFKTVATSFNLNCLLLSTMFGVMIFIMYSAFEVVEIKK